MSFDPSQPFKVVEQPTGFDPSQPFAVIDDPAATREKEDRAKWGLANVGGQFAQGALDQGVGSMVEGGLRIADELTRKVKGELASPELTQALSILEKLRADEKAVQERGLKVPNLPARLAAAEQRVAALSPAQQPALDQIAQAPGLRPAIAKTGEFRQAVREVYPVDSDVAASIPGQVASGIGQAVGGLPAYLTGLGLPASAGQLFDQGYQDAKQSGADDDTALEAGILNLPAGVLEQIGDKFQIGGLVKALREGNRGAAAVVRETLKGFLAEGVTEGAQQAYQNTVAKQVYAPDRKIAEGVGTAAVVGGLTGATVAAGASSLGEGLAALDTGRNVPESAATLLEQQKQMLAGKRPAMMFPKGTEEIALPEGMKRVENERGVFHYDPKKITGDEILSASRDGRENELLALGSVSKPEAEARAAATGEKLVAVTERTPAGVEVKSVVGTTGTAAQQASELEKSKTPGNTITVEPIGKTLVERLRAKEAELQARAREETAAEEVRRGEAKARRDADKQRFTETLLAADLLAMSPTAEWPAVNGALTSLNNFVDDTSYALNQEQKEAALKRIRALTPREAELRVSRDAEADAALEASRAQAKAAEAAKLARVRADNERIDAMERTGRDPDTGKITDLAKLPDDELQTLDFAGEGFTEKQYEAELTRRERQAAEESNRAEFTLRDLFVGRRDKLAAAGLERPLRLPTPATERGRGGLGGELAVMQQGGVPFAYFDKSAKSLDTLREQLVGLGFRAETESDVLALVSRAFNGEDVRPETAGEVQFATADTKPAEDRLLSQEWKRVASQAEAFQYPKSSAKSVAQVAADMSTPELRITATALDYRGKAVPGEPGDGAILFESSKGGELLITSNGEAGRKIYSVDASPNLIRQPKDGGSQLYQAAFTWAHNNGVTIQVDTLSKVNELRRTSAMLSSALRHNTTDHLLPAASQQVPWKRGDHETNIAELARAEMKKVFTALPAAEKLAIAYDREAIIDPASGNDLPPADVADILRANGGPAAHGVGIATLRRALLTRDAIGDAQGRSTGISEDAGPGRRATQGILYATQKAKPSPASPAPAPAQNRASGSAQGSRVKPRALLTPEQVARQFAALRTALGPVAREFDLQVGLVADLLEAEGYTREARDLRAGKLGSIQAATAPRLQSRITSLRAQQRFIVINAEAAQQGKAPGLLLHEIGHPFYDALPEETKAVLREMHAQETENQTGPLYKKGELVTDVAITADRFPPARIQADPDLAVKEWFAERIRRLNEAWLEGRMPQGERPLLLRLWQQLIDRMSAVFAQVRRLTLGDDLFRETFRTWLESGLQANIGPDAAAYAARQGAQFAAAARRAEPVTTGISAEILAKNVPVIDSPQTAFESSNRENRQALIESLPEGGVPVANSDQRVDIVLSRATLRHSFGSANGPAAYGTLAQARALLASAVRIGDTLENLPPDGVKLHRYLAAANQRDGVVPVRITVSERKDGSFHAYDIQPIGHKKKLKPTTPSLNVRDGDQPQQAYTVADLLPEVKQDDDGTYRAEFATTDPERTARAAELKANPPEGVTTGDKLAEATLSESAKAARHPAAVADPAPGDAWAMAPRMSTEQLVAEQKKIAEHLDEYALDLADIEKANLQARAAALKAEQVRRLDETIANAPKVTALPKSDRKAALLAEWRRGKALREDGLRTGNDTAQDEGQSIVNRAKARLDDEFPDWEKTAYAPKAPIASRPSPIAREAEDDGRNLPPAPPAEPPENGAPVPDDAAPDRGRARAAFGDSAYTPPWFEKSWAKIRDALVGIRGSIPELPAFPALAAKSDRFIRDNGPEFYNRLKEFYRTLQSANDGIQKRAEEQVAAITSPLLKIGGDFNAADYRLLKRRKEQLRRNRAEGKPMPAAAAAELDAVQSRLEAHPYVLFNKLVYFMDLDWRARNLKDSEGNPIKLPEGMNQTEIDNELARLGRLIAASPHAAAIETAYEKHTALVARVADDLKSRDLLAAEHLANPVYFPHLTLEMTRGGETVQRELTPERVRVGTEADFRGYLQEPVGSTKPIESDYVRAMYYHLVQVGAHNFKADAIRDHARPYDIRAEVEKRAKELSKQRGKAVAWSQVFHEEYAPRGYVLYGTDSRDAFPTVMVDRDKLARRLGEALTSADLHTQLRELGVRGVKLLPEDLKETLIQGQRETWIVPARVAEALRGIADRQTQSDKPIESALKAVNSAWKRWKLFMPQNHARYEYGNIVADLEKLFSASPRTFRYLGQSAKEMRAFFQGEAPSADLRDALNAGVINAITAQEIDQLQRLRAFEKFQTAGERIALQVRKRASSALYQPVTNLIGLGDLSSVELSAFREGVTRYANYLANLDAIRNGARPDYAGAYWRDIEAIGDSSPGAGDKVQRQAAQISKATFGDYGDLSLTGQYLRDKLIPFYSWMEVNFKYHANLLRNLRDQVRGDLPGDANGAAATAARIASARVGGFLLRLALPYAAIMLWNAAGPHGIEDDELSEEDRRRLHIRLGKDDNGKPMIVYANTALADVMKWFGGARFAQAAAAWLTGKTDFPTALDSWAGELGGDFVNNTIGSTGPTVKIPASIITRKNFFPDVLDARTIPDYDLRRNLIGQMTDDFTADVIERAVSKDYYASKDFGTWAKQLILQARQRDPESWAFYSIKDKAAAYEERMTGRKEGATDFNAPDQQVLRNFRRAIYQGDVEAAARFYLRLLDLGYTSERFTASIRSQDPLSTLPKELRRPFVESLSETDRAQLDRAYQYYVRITASRGRERALFPSREWSPAAQERFTQRPRVELLQSVAGRAETMTPEELTRRAEMELRRSLQPR
jgi:hypothetical protein